VTESSWQGPPGTVSASPEHTDKVGVPSSQAGAIVGANLLAQDLADDHPVGTHAHRPPHKIGTADPLDILDILDIGFSRLKSDDLLVAFGEAIER
jgi:hypothetical protein